MVMNDLVCGLGTVPLKQNNCLSYTQFLRHAIYIQLFNLSRSLSHTHSLIQSLSPINFFFLHTHSLLLTFPVTQKFNQSLTFFHLLTNTRSLFLSLTLSLFTYAIIQSLSHSISHPLLYSLAFTLTRSLIHSLYRVLNTPSFTVYTLHYKLRSFH